MCFTVDTNHVMIAKVAVVL